MFWVNEEKWNGLVEQLNRIERQQRRLMEQLLLQGRMEMLDFKDVVAKVAAQKTVVDSSAVAIAGIRAQLAALLAQPQPPSQADLQAVLDGLDANTNGIVAAIPEGTDHPPVTAETVAAAVAAAPAVVASAS